MTGNRTLYRGFWDHVANHQPSIAAFVNDLAVPANAERAAGGSRLVPLFRGRGTTTVHPSNSVHCACLLSLIMGRRTQRVEDIPDKCVVFEQGTIIAPGTPHDILHDHDLLRRSNLMHSHRHNRTGALGHVHQLE